MNGGKSRDGGSGADGRTPPWPISTDGGSPTGSDGDPDEPDEDRDHDGEGRTGGDHETDGPGERSDRDGDEAGDEPADPEDEPADPEDEPADPEDVPDRQSVIRDQRAEIDRLRSEVRELQDRVDRKTVDRDDLEGSLRRYVRWRQRHGHARGWGPYVVLGYGVILTLAAFFSSHLYGGWTILAMIVIWLSTLGLYALMLIVGWGLTGTAWLGAARSAVEKRR